MEEEKKTVLVVDDDQSVLTTFARILERNGYNVDTAETGNQAITKLQTKDYDIVLIDLKLPDIDGTDVLRKIPKSASKTVKIIITGFSTQESGLMAADYGADDYLVKPLKPEELLEVIKEAALLKESE